MGELTKQTESILLHKLNALQEAINYTHSCTELSEKTNLIYNGKDRFGQEIWLNKNKTYRR